MSHSSSHYPCWVCKPFCALPPGPPTTSSSPQAPREGLGAHFRAISPPPGLNAKPQLELLLYQQSQRSAEGRPSKKPGEAPRKARKRGWDVAGFGFWAFWSGSPQVTIGPSPEILKPKPLTGCKSCQIDCQPQAFRPWVGSSGLRVYTIQIHGGGGGGGGG